MSLRFGVLTDMLRQSLPAPDLRRVTEVFRLGQAKCTTQAFAASVSVGVLPWGVSLKPADTPIVSALLIHLETLLRVIPTAFIITAMFSPV